MVISGFLTFLLEVISVEVVGLLMTSILYIYIYIYIGENEQMPL